MTALALTSVRTLSALPRRLAPAATLFGPGFLVMLADTDAGSLVTAAQSGAQRGYSLLLLQFLLIPVLFIVQELALRLGLVTGKGQGALLRERFGAPVAWLSAVTLAVACLGALITELAGMAGVGALFGVPVPVTVALVVAAILAMVLSASYRSVERVALLFGLFELAFILVAWRSQPDLGAVAAGLATAPLGDRSYLYLLAANIGAVIMPWMVFYQQSAVVEKGLGVADLPAARRETALGAVVTQIVASSVLIAAAATIGSDGKSGPLETVQQIAEALTPYLGAGTGRLVFALGMSGAALVATIVVALTATWGLAEAAGARQALARGPAEAPLFYAGFAAALVGAGAIVGSGVDLVAISVAVQVVNALLLPFVLGSVFLLAVTALPEPFRLKGSYRWIVGVTLLATAGFGVVTGLAGAVA
jgi:Mn2+/Fe2+ NRAMP family transporter